MVAHDGEVALHASLSLAIIAFGSTEVRRDLGFIHYRSSMVTSVAGIFFHVPGRQKLISLALPVGKVSFSLIGDSSAGSGISGQKQHTSCYYCTCYDCKDLQVENQSREKLIQASESTHDLCFPSSLYQRLSPRVLCNSLDIVGKPTY